MDEVRVCVEAKTNFFGEYFTVPEELLQEVDTWRRDTMALGETCAHAQEFEEKFVSEGLSDRFNALIPRCTPKARKMTREEKRVSAGIAKDILWESKEELARDALSDVVGGAVTRAKDEQLQRNRERMIKEGTLADHTIRKNRIDAAFGIIRLLGKKSEEK